MTLLTCVSRHQLLPHDGHFAGRGGRGVEGAATGAVGRVGAERAAIAHLLGVGAAVQTPALVALNQRTNSLSVTGNSGAR